MRMSKHPSVWFIKQEEKWLRTQSPSDFQTFANCIYNNETVSDGSEPVIFFCCSQMETVLALRSVVDSFLYTDSFSNETYLTRLTDPMFGTEVFREVLNDYVGTEDLNLITTDGETALLRSIKEGDLNKSRALLENGAKILRGKHLNIPSPRPPVLYGLEEYEAVATERNSSDLLKLLYDFGLILTAEEKNSLYNFASVLKRHECADFILSNF